LIIVFQFLCVKCLKSYATRERLRTHALYCVQCPKCGDMVEQRHIEKCKGRRFTNPRFACGLCSRLRSKHGLREHMEKKHGMKGWRFEDHPELLTEVCPAPI
jgi:hypothetical protein